MSLVWYVVYSYVVLPVLWVTIHVMALFKRKVRHGLRARRRLFPMLERHIEHKLETGKRVWFHASSLGEFEQAKPIIAALKERYPTLRIIVTFFSPSGYEHSRKYPLADAVSYIPIDTPRNARRFVRSVNPDCAVIIRYDVWPNHVWELHRRGIPALIANATMRATSKRRLPVVRQFHRCVYETFDKILTVSEQDVQAFALFRLRHPLIEPIGDTRFDQVALRCREARKRHLIAPAVLQNKKVIVAGSTWPDDEEVLLPAFQKLRERVPQLLLILVPHEPTIDHLEELESDLQGQASFIRFSALNDYSGEHVIIVDSIGVLMALYSYAHVTYIGGGFKQNVHNVLEAAVYGVPVVYGQRHKNSQEAIALAERGGGFVVSDGATLYETLHHLLMNDRLRTRAGTIAGAFVQEHTGATERFVKHIEQFL